MKLSTTEISGLHILLGTRRKAGQGGELPIPYLFRCRSRSVVIAATTLHCATIASIDDSGKYFNDCDVGRGQGPGKFHPKSDDVEGNARRLWERTEKLVSSWLLSERDANC